MEVKQMIFEEEEDDTWEVRTTTRSLSQKMKMKRTGKLNKIVYLNK